MRVAKLQHAIHMELHKADDTPESARSRESSCVALLPWPRPSPSRVPISFPLYQGPHITLTFPTCATPAVPKLLRCRYGADLPASLSSGQVVQVCAQILMRAGACQLSRRWWHPRSIPQLNTVTAEAPRSLQMCVSDWVLYIICMYAPVPGPGVLLHSMPCVCTNPFQGWATCKQQLWAFRLPGPDAWPPQSIIF